MNSDGDQNLDYQSAKSRSGGSYTEAKLKRLDLPLLIGKKFLDLGCNTGFYCRWAHEQGATHVVGVDNSSRVIEKAREQSPSEILFRDTGWDDFPHGSYDVVVLLSAIHYAKSPRSVVRNIRRSLSEGGILVLEGGVLFVGESRKTDIPLPGWRTVGDRCLHLTQEFIQNHLLVDFDWQMRGESEMRGGDEVSRYVLHAAPNGPECENEVFDFDVLDFFSAAKQSSATIVESQPAYDYVAPLKNVGKPDAAYVSRVLSDSHIFNLFINDLNFSLRAVTPVVLRLHQSVDRDIIDRIESAIEGPIQIERV